MTNSLGIYIHVPYCEKKCTYCNFYSAPPSDDIRNRYIDRTLKELKRWGAETMRPVDTVYFGGGTPSLLKPRELEEILVGIRENFSITKDAEITCEVNPGDDLEPFLEVALPLGVNRISIGMQSVNEDELVLLGRRHSFKDVQNSVSTLHRKGLDNISVDLMLGLPGSDTYKLDRSIDAAFSLNVPHISAYILKIEENTPLFLCKDKLNLADEDMICDQYIHLCKRLSEHGFEHYEISNFAKCEKFSRHNLRYWQGNEYIGIGPSAYSYLLKKRFHYPADMAEFIENGTVVFDENGGGLEEFVMLRLRLKFGLDLNELCEKFSISNIDPLLELAIKLSKAGLCNFSGKRIQLTDEGMLVSNSIILKIIGAIDENL